ncbi:PRKR-interacting protein 1-like protein [Psilocybe cubensis]|uniref:PRKR-interacting protein 1-like protein n=2 Tax=Psilocybe cubensis TaxID=181762 RepID=A0ACB8HBQ6_PSICU|nr:PRKR-interacting protein 1-like protein [Psilocybe cubensis]KAH9485440.1 PRKR-interacting protein 1-like protein [Psilocybe cubensis]
MSSTSASTSTAPTHRHALTAVEKQRSQLEKLLKDPAKPVYIPPPPKEKTIRPAREMMKNVQGSSAGAGSGEFHVYKASRRREYERLKLLEEASNKEIEDAEFERRRRETEELANAKTVKNRAKRQKRKERAKTKGTRKDESEAPAQETSDLPIKKRRIVNGEEMVFRKPTEASDDSDDEGQLLREPKNIETLSQHAPEPASIAIEPSRITILEDD